MAPPLVMAGPVGTVAEVSRSGDDIITLFYYRLLLLHLILLVVKDRSEFHMNKGLYLLG